jgi:DNA-binding MarR family transcriptional regulator
MTSRTYTIYRLLKELRCATALEIAERLGAARKSVQTYLNRLASRGLVEKRVLGRRAVMYCVRAEDIGDKLHNKRRRRRRGAQDGYMLYAKTQKRLTQTLETLQREGCISVGALMRTLGVSHTKAYHMLRVSLLTGRGVKVRIGKTAILCRDRATAEEAVLRLRETIHRLVVENGMRYVTATKVLRAALNDREAYELLSRFVPLRRNAVRFPPVVLTFVNDILESLYGEPLRHGNRRIYVVAQQPRAGHGFEIIDGVETHVVRVSLPDDLAEALQGVDVNQAVLQAVEQLLARHRP